MSEACTGRGISGKLSERALRREVNCIFIDLCVLNENKFKLNQKLLFIPQEGTFNFVILSFRGLINAMRFFYIYIVSKSLPKNTFKIFCLTFLQHSVSR